MLRGRKESLERGWERREERGKEDERERERSSEENKVREHEGDRFVCVCVCVCVWGGTNLRKEMGALRVLSTPFSSSHS